MECKKCGGTHIIVYRTYTRETEFFNGKRTGSKLRSANCGEIQCQDCMESEIIGE